MRLARVVALAVLLLAATLVMPALAQTPNPAPSVTVALEKTEGFVSVENAAEFKATVTNTGSSSGSDELDAQNAGDVTVTITGIPAGWTASASPASFRLAAQKPQAVTVQVSVSPDGAAQTAELTVTAVITTPLNRLDPILGNFPGGTQTATGSDSMTVTRDDSITRDVLEAIGPWIYAILLLMVAAVLVAVAISVSSRRSLVRLAADTHELSIAPGGRVSFPFQIEGLAKEADSVLLHVSAVQDGWAAFLPVPELTLAPGQVREMSLVVIAPKAAAEGTRQALLVSATTAKAPKGSANLEFVAVVEKTASPAVAAARRKK